MDFNFSEAMKILKTLTSQNLLITESYTGSHAVIQLYCRSSIKS